MSIGRLDIAIQKNREMSILRQAQRQTCGDGRFTRAAFAAGNCNSH